MATYLEAANIPKFEEAVLKFEEVGMTVFLARNPKPTPNPIDRASRMRVKAREI